MEPIVILLVLGGMLYGFKRATEDATAATKRLFRGSGHSSGGHVPPGHVGGSGSRVSTGHGGTATTTVTRSRYVATGTGRGAGVGRTVATGTAAVVAGTGVVRREFAAGWRRGWPEGRERARARFGGPQMAEDTANVDPAPATNHDGTTQPKGQPTMATATRRGRHRFRRGDKERAPVDEQADTTNVDPATPGHDIPTAPTNAPPILTAVPDRPTEPPPNGTTQPKGQPAMTTTRTADINSMDDYEQQLEADIKRSADEVDDAQAGMQRAEQDAQRIDETIASLADMEVDPDTLAELGAVGEAVESRMNAHRALLQAAENELAANEAALQGVRKRHGVIKEHADVVANRQFYREG